MKSSNRITLGLVAGAGLMSAALALMLPTPHAVQAEDQQAPATTEWVQQTSWQGEPNFKVSSMFHDVFRSTHIAIGRVSAVTYPSSNVKITFEPTEYLMGSPIDTPSVDLITNFNGDLRHLVGTEVVCGMLHAANGKWGLTHGLESVTPVSWDVSASVQMYRDLVSINAEYSEEIAIALDENPMDGRFNFPDGLMSAWTDLLVRNFGKTDTIVAHHAGRVLFKEPMFQGRLTNEHVQAIANAVRRSGDQTFDRGYGFMLLTKYESTALTVAEVMDLMKREVAKINLDHLAVYLHHTRSAEEVVPALSAIILDRTQSNKARRNAIIVAGQFGSREILPTMHQVLGRETNRELARQILNTYRYLSDAQNYGPLVSYLNGGNNQGYAVRTQSDCRDSIELLKRTLVAIAMIDTDESNKLIEHAYYNANEEWLRDFINPLRLQNKAWRVRVDIMDEEMFPLNG